MAHITLDHITSTEMQQCIEECFRCHSACLQTERHCLDLGGRHADVHHLVLLADCAEICRTSANFMLRGSPRHARTCALCAEVCRECEEECRRMAGGDNVMQQCADVCHRCAESCDRMAKMAA
jgi:hypothetical protein